MAVVVHVDPPFFFPHLTQNQHPTKKLPESGGNLAEVMSEVEEWCPRSWVRESEGVVCWERGLRFQKGGLRFWAKLSFVFFFRQSNIKSSQLDSPLEQRIHNLVDTLESLEGRLVNFLQGIMRGQSRGKGQRRNKSGTSSLGSSKTTRHPAPWSSTP